MVCAQPQTTQAQTLRNEVGVFRLMPDLAEDLRGIMQLLA
jgi:hypothetical protein